MATDLNRISDALHQTISQKNMRKFNLNCDFNDINDRFFLFECEGIEYVAKKCTAVVAENEMNKAAKAKQLLDGKAAGRFLINVVVPVCVTVDNIRYLVTPYLGQTMSGIRYQGGNIDFSLDDFFCCIDLMERNCIVYRGFLPRNICKRDNVLCIFDWEDAIFFNSQSELKYNLCWQTNMLVNWQYVFESEMIKTRMQEKYPENDFVEPDLVTYEKIFKELTQTESSDVACLRKRVRDIVVWSERPVDDGSIKPRVFPNDCAHNVVDLLGNLTDVFFDIICYSLRLRNEESFCRNIDVIGRIFNNAQIDFSEKKFLIGFIVLMMADRDCDNVIITEINSIKNIFANGNFPRWCRAYLNKTPDRELKIKEMIRGNLSDICLCEELIDDFCNYMSGLGEEPFSVKTLNYIIKEYKINNSIPGCFEICPIENGFTDCNKNELMFILSSIRDFMHTEGCDLNGIYSESGSTLFITFYVDVLKRLNISPEEYQPGIAKYLSEFPEDFIAEENYKNFMCRAELYFGVKRKKYERFFC